MADVYHVIVKTPDGSLKLSEKEKESSGKKSADAFVNFKSNPGAIVIFNKKVIYGIPVAIKSDKKFIDAAMKLAYRTGPAAPPPPRDKPATAPGTIPPKLRSLAAEYDAEVKTGATVIPKSQKKADPCTVRILENACIASSLGQGVPIEAAKLICGDSKQDIESLAINISSGTISLDDALQELVGTGCCKVVNTIMEDPDKILPTHTPNIAKVIRGRKDKILPKTRMREDIGNAGDEEDLNALKNRSIPDGIIIYTKKENDDAVHEMVAYAMGYTPSSLINSHYPAQLAGFDYRRVIPLMRPHYSNPVWTAFGKRIGSPKTLISRIQEKYDEPEVKIIVANGIELA